MPASTPTVDSRSNRLRGLVALMTPAPSPTISHSTTLPTTTDAVIGRSWARIVLTDSPVKYEMPRFPRTVLPRKCQYCTRIGWSSPRFLITSLMTCGEAARPASSLATICTGLAKNRKNVPVATIHSTMMPARIRRTRNRVRPMADHSPSVETVRAPGSGRFCLPRFLVAAKSRSVRGSIASLMPSPSRLNASVVISSAAAGKTTYHHATW